MSNDTVAMDVKVCDFVDQGIICTNKNLHITYANRWVEIYSGRTAEYLKGKRLEEAFPEIRKNNRISFYFLALQGNHVSISHEIGEPLFLLSPSVEHPDIVNMIQNVKIYPLIEDGDIRGTITMIKDVTRDFLDNRKLERTVQDLQKARNDLIKSRELYKALVETISEILVICNERGIVSYISPSARSVLDIDPDQVMGTPWAVWVHPEDMPRVSRILDVFTKSVDKRRLFQNAPGLELRLRDRHGGWHYFEGVASIIKSGNMRGHLAISLRNIEQRKELEDRLKREETFLRTILDTVGVLIVVLDTKGRIILFNKACEAITGYKASEVIGKPVWDVLIPKDQRDEVIRVFSSLKKSLLPNAHENYWVTKKGEKRLISWSNSIVTDENKEIQYVIGSGIDITDQKELEEKLISSRQELLNQVHELEERNRMLGTANQMNETLTASTSEEEIYKTISVFMPRIFSSFSGVVLMNRQKEEVFTPHTAWGEKFNECSFVQVSECWAARTGRMYFCMRNNECLCSHSEVPLAKGYRHLCVPILYGSKCFGVICIGCSNHSGEKTTEFYAKRINFMENVVLMVARMIGIALNNSNLHKQLRDMSIRDPLTGLFNRRFMEETLTKEWHRAVREKRPLGLIMLDLDHFKRFNDTYGHLAGDNLLRYFGKFLQKNIRASDTPCRYGGEEFLIIMPGANLEVATKRANFLREAYSKELVPLNGNYIEGLTVSGGVAAYPESAKNIQEIIRLVDEALYEAKKSGRNRIVRAVGDRTGVRFELISGNGDVSPLNTKRFHYSEDEQQQEHYQ